MQKANAHLKKAYPELTKLFNYFGPTVLVLKDTVPVAESITQIVTGQMLSNKAASAIYGRIIETRDAIGCGGSWRLDSSLLQSLGLSGRKVKTIKSFGEEYDADPDFFESWRSLPYESLKDNVCAYWGLSSWSVDMLAIFYFGQTNIFPVNDGTVKKAISLLERNIYDGEIFDPEKAAPYKTYLSLYMWKIIDFDYFSQ